MKTWLIPRITGTISVGAGRLLLMKSVTFTAVSDATVGNRRMAVVIRDADGNLKSLSVASADQAASVTVIYAFGISSQDTSFLGATNVITSRLSADVVLEPGDTLAFTDLGAVSASDTIGLIVVGYDDAWWRGS